jgi:guanylate kinase
MEQNKMILFTAPSGAGKTTIVRHLLAKFDFLDFSVSATTRECRAHEVEGKDYYFFSLEEFNILIDEKAFVEWEEVYIDQYYGTLKSEIERLWSLGKTIVFDIDVKGARNIKEMYGDQCLAVFVCPPSIEVLIQRLINRKTESEASLRKRIARVKSEMVYKNSFDQILINDNLDQALEEAEQIVLSFVEGLYESRE